ncbi:hypothetical protein QBZ16_003274 [Prototheca wickerhamii]|uniref:riboflavin kinase n=1 Tax=Prototheca wickerhamii TaxID=3111 RepID=A0AAD9MHE4_PROWI|nr:hypothetical protein QBZ16_003274 [Prototheca wickerhamii]
MEQTGRTQASYFSGKVVNQIAKSITPRVDAKLERVAQSVPGLGPDSRVLDARGVRDILGVDVAVEMLDKLKESFGSAPPLGNEPAVRTWLGDFMELPTYMGPVDAIFFNAVFGNMEDPHAALYQATRFLKPGGYICISHPLGRPWLEQYRKREPDIVPHPLPSESDLIALTRDLPLKLRSCTDEKDFYCAILEVERDRLAFARVDAAQGSPPEDLAVHPMLMNVGRRPTFRDEGEPPLSVEASIQHRFAHDFYGCHMRVVALGFLRPEIKFGSLDELLAQIQRDTGVAKATLTEDELAEWAQKL